MGQGGLQRGGPRGHVGLVRIDRQRLLIVGKGLRIVAHFFAYLAHRGPVPCIARVQPHGLGQHVRRRLLVAEFLVQPGKFHARLGQRGRLCGPVLDQGEGVLGAVFFDQEHRQPAVAVAVVGVPIQALAVAGLGAGEIVVLVLKAAEAMVGSAKVVVTVSVGRIGVGGGLELDEGLLILAALKEGHAVGVVAVGDEIGAAAGRCQAKN